MTSPPPIARPAATLYAAFDSDPAPIVEFLAWLVAAGGHGPEPVRALDVGCGIGRLLAPLAGRGWQVTGLEPDAEYAAYAAERVRSVAGAEVRVGGFADVEAQVGGMAAFDLVAAINGSFAYLPTPATRAAALAQCRRVMRTGGLLVLDLPNLLRILFEYGGPAVHEREVDGRTIRLERRHRIDHTRALFITDESYVVHEAAGAPWTLRREHAYAITTWPELAHALTVAGFSTLRTFTSFEARAPEPLGPGRMLIVAEAG